MAIAERQTAGEAATKAAIAMQDLCDALPPRRPERLMVYQATCNITDLAAALLTEELREVPV